MTVNTSSKLYTTTIQYSCDGEYRFADNAQFKESTCNYLGYWVPSIIECDGTYVFLSFICTCLTRIWFCNIVTNIFTYVSEAETESFKETYKPAEAKNSSIYGTVMIVILGLSLAALVVIDMASIGRSLSLLMYNINVSDNNPFSQNGGDGNVNNVKYPPLMYSAYYHRRSMGMFHGLNQNGRPQRKAESTARGNSHFKSRPGWNDPPPPKPKKIYIAS